MSQNEPLSYKEFKYLTDKLEKLEQMLSQCNEFNDPEIENYKIPLADTIKAIRRRLGIEN